MHVCDIACFKGLQERKYYKTKHISFKDNHVALMVLAGKILVIY